jgi:hypothetical protein
MFKIGQRVKLTPKGKAWCTAKPVEEKESSYVFKGTIEDIVSLRETIYVVKMDDEGFMCKTHGNGYNTFPESALKEV